MAVKKIPMRKCAGCDCMKEKKELIRIVHTPEDEFIVDFSGKKSGRGVYLCHSKACLETARKKKSLDRSLKCTLPDTVYEALAKQLEQEGRDE